MHKTFFVYQKFPLLTTQCTCPRIFYVFPCSGNGLKLLVKIMVLDLNVKLLVPCKIWKKFWLWCILYVLKIFIEMLTINKVIVVLLNLTSLDFWTLRYLILLPLPLFKYNNMWKQESGIRLLSDNMMSSLIKIFHAINNHHICAKTMLLPRMSLAYVGSKRVNTSNLFFMLM